MSSENNLLRELKMIIPPRHDKFDKLTAVEPYYFDSWKKDIYGNDCLYYWFYSKDKNKINKKRVVSLEELKKLRD